MGVDAVIREINRKGLLTNTEMNSCLMYGKNQDYPAARAEGLIESGILDFADSLYAIGCFPLSSSEGAIDVLSWLSRLFSINSKIQQPQFRPFVEYFCSIELGKKISTIDTSSTKYNWFIYSYLNPRFNEFVWVIELKDYRMFNCEIDKQDVRCDLKKLGLKLRQHFNKSDKSNMWYETSWRKQGM
jgi:hypothetical protein